MRTHATVALVDHMCRQSPQAGRKSATWSITGRLSTKRCNGHIEPIALALTVSATLDHRPARIAQVSVQPLLPQHGNEGSKEGDQETRVHETGGGDDLAGWILLNRWNNGGLAGDGGLIESEEDCTEEGCGLLVWIGLKVGTNVDDES